MYWVGHDAADAKNVENIKRMDSLAEFGEFFEIFGSYKKRIDEDYGTWLAEQEDEPRLILENALRIMDFGNLTPKQMLDYIKAVR